MMLCGPSRGMRHVARSCGNGITYVMRRHVVRSAVCVAAAHRVVRGRVQPAREAVEARRLLEPLQIAQDVGERDQPFLVGRLQIEGRGEELELSQRRF